MNISTKFHGELEINEQGIIKFENGIPGFLDEKNFILLALEETLFFVLQSTTTPEVAFIIVNPFDILPSYDFELPQDVLNELHIQSEEDVTIFAIVTVRDPFKDSTANLQAPVIINMRSHLGKQYIMNTDQYTTRHLLIQPPILEKQEVR